MYSTYLPDSGRCLLIEQEQIARRAEARERLSLEEQAARGLLDVPPTRTHLRSRREPRAAARFLAQAIKQTGRRAIAVCTLLFGSNAATGT
jgi:hypothetical protein